MTVTTVAKTDYLLWPLETTARQYYLNTVGSRCSTQAERELPQPYTRRVAWTSCSYIGPGVPGNVPHASWDAPNAGYCGYIISATDTHISYIDGLAYNRARSMFVEKAMDSLEAQAGASIAEGREALSAIRSRGLQLCRLVRSVKRADFGGILANLSQNDVHFYTRHKGRLDLIRAKIKDGTLKGANLWLEMWFGWLPMVSDIRASLDVLGSEATNKDKPIKVSAKSKAAPFKYDVSYGFKTSTELYCQYKIGGVVRVTNSNVFTANQLGLLNVAGTAWEVTRLSFLVDWLFNVSEYLKGMTDTFGWEVVPGTGYIARFALCRGTWTYRPTPTQFWADYEYFGSYFKRTVTDSLPGPRFLVRKLEGLSPTRALTALSLLRVRLNSL